MADSTLQAIQNKVRRIVRAPSTAQLSDSDLNQYINTFVLYDMPENIRLFSLRTNITFYTQPNIDTYTSSTNPNDPLYNFVNNYIAVHPPVYLAGIPGFYTQQREVFYGVYPQTVTIIKTNVYGDGATTTFTGNIFSAPFLQNNVTMTALNANGTSMVMVDYPFNNVIGAFGLYNASNFGTVPNPTPVPGTNQVNYINGNFSITFPSPPASGAQITAEVQSYNPGKPLAILYYDNQFIIRPVPDQTYTIELEADIRPTQLLSQTQSPQIEQWWQYLSWGAAKKIFEDRMDVDSLAQMMPMYKEQENLVLRTTLTQQANERTITLYVQGKNYGFGPVFGAGGWPY